MRRLATTFTQALCASALALCLSAAAEARNRIALVIGNDTYQTVTKLRNARADANTMAAAFQAAGYTVTLRKDRNLREFKDDVREFRGKISGGDEVAFYFSGHGVTVGAANHLLPVDVRDQTEAQVADDSLALNDVLAQFAEAKPALTLAIIDACRDNPFPPKPGRSLNARGLAPSGSGGTGQMVIYSAGNGQKALDRLSNADPIKNGVFTRVFAEEMKKPGVLVRDVLFNVRDEVVRLAQTAKHEQVPAIYDQVVGRFYFRPASLVAEPRQDTRPAQPVQPEPRPVQPATPIAAAPTRTTGYSKISNRGELLPDSATLGEKPDDWACTKDNATGLIWEVKTTSGLRDQKHSYTWFDRNVKDGNRGKENGGTCHQVGRCDTEKFVQDVNATGLCGAKNWRMPSIDELKWIMNEKYEKQGKATINPVFFPNTPRSYVWSGSPHVYDGDRSAAWQADFHYAGASVSHRSFWTEVRLVRGGP